MQDGSMPVDEFRGFAAVHPTVPALVVNTQDDPRARAFSIVHELGHLTATVCGIAPQEQTETWCNDFAGDVLMPPHWLAKAFAATTGRPLLARVDALAGQFSVTPLGAAVRLARRSLVPQAEIEAVIELIQRRERRPRGRGGDYYRNQIPGSAPGSSAWCCPQ